MTTTKSIRISARHHTAELMAVLLAGIGLGVGIAALVIGHGSATQHVVVPAHAQRAQTSGNRLPPATAGVQPGREEPKIYGGAAGQTEAEAAASRFTAPVLAPHAGASFATLTASLPGHVELAVTPLGSGRLEVLGSDEAAHGWSTTKVPVLVALLRARGSEGLTSQEQAWAQSAITESNNESVLALFGDLKGLEGGLDGASQYMDGVLRMSGDSETVVTTAPPPPGAITTFGQTEWSPGEAVKFFRALALGCLLSSSQTSYVLGLMESIEPSESWGLGSAGFSSVAFKGGWGPENGGGYLVRQSGIVDPQSSSKGVAVAIVAFAPSFGTGTEMLTSTATWLRHHLRLSSRPSAGCASK
jgi:hypothetical protein